MRLLHVIAIYLEDTYLAAAAGLTHSSLASKKTITSWKRIYDLVPNGWQQMCRFPAERTAIVILTNTDPTNTQSIAQGAADIILDP